jgi:hypothetical protein
MIKYTESFIQKCKNLYPGWDDLHFQLDRHSKNAGRYLEDAVGLALDENTIIALFKNNKQHKILEAAQRAQAKRMIYNEWVRIIDKHAEKFGYEL